MTADKLETWTRAGVIAFLVGIAGVCAWAGVSISPPPGGPSAGGTVDETARAAASEAYDAATNAQTNATAAADLAQEAYDASTNAVTNAAAATAMALDGYTNATNAVALHFDPSGLSTNIYSDPGTTTTLARATGRYVALHMTNSTVLTFDLADFPTNMEHTVSLGVWIGYGNALTFDEASITNAAELGTLATNAWNDLVFRRGHGKELFWVRQ